MHLVPVEVKLISTVSHTMINFKHSPDNLMDSITSFKPYCVKHVVSFENCSPSRVKRDQRYITGHLEFNTCLILYHDVLQHKKTVLHQQYQKCFAMTEMFFLFSLTTDSEHLIPGLHKYQHGTP